MIGCRPAVNEVLEFNYRGKTLVTFNCTLIILKVNEYRTEHRNVRQNSFRLAILVTLLIHFSDYDFQPVNI